MGRKGRPNGLTVANEPSSCRVSAAATRQVIAALNSNLIYRRVGPDAKTLLDLIHDLTNDRRKSSEEFTQAGNNSKTGRT